MASVGALRPGGLRRRLPWALGHCLAGLWKHFLGVFGGTWRTALPNMREWSGGCRLLPG